jgi:hypothetical protein
MSNVDERYHVILDLDLTIICACDIDKEPESLKKYKDKFNDGKNKDDRNYVVFRRHGLQPFLDFLFKNFKVSVWTHGTREYACDIVNNTIYKKGKNSRNLEYLLVRYHCDISSMKFGEITKKLTMLRDVFKLDFDMDKTILIDDNTKHVYKGQEGNVINITEFDIDFEGVDEDYIKNDNALHIVQNYLQEILNKKSSVCNEVNEANKYFKE